LDSLNFQTFHLLSIIQNFFDFCLFSSIVLGRFSLETINVGLVSEGYRLDF
jgi:hypothetical protein